MWAASAEVWRCIFIFLNKTQDICVLNHDWWSGTLVVPDVRWTESKLKEERTIFLASAVGAK